MSHTTRYDRQEAVARRTLTGDVLDKRLAAIDDARAEDDAKRHSLRRGLGGKQKSARGTP